MVFSVHDINFRHFQRNADCACIIARFQSCYVGHISMIHSDTLKLLKLSGAFEQNDVVVLLTAPTGVAAFNINGMKLYSALLLGQSKYSGFQPLSHDRLNTLRAKLSHLMLLIVDEVSMIGSNMLLEIYK